MRAPVTLAALVSALALGAAACAPPQYVYLPQETHRATVAGRVGATYAIPPAAPQGNVKVASFGIAPVTPPNAEGPIDALHVRLVLDNRGPLPWRVDPRDQLVSIPSEGQSRPLYAVSDAPGMPQLVIPPGGRRTVDLFYPLPTDFQGAEAVPDFEVIWRVDAGGQPIALRTPFKRVDLTPVPPERTIWYEYGFGQYFWSDPFYSQLTFRHPYLPPPSRARQTAKIGTPTWRF